MRYVKFSPEEMAYDCPADTSDPKKYPTIGKDENSWSKFINFRRGYARLTPELRKAFPNDAAVNEALEIVLKLRQLPLLAGKVNGRKTA